MFQYLADRFGSGEYIGEALWIGNLGHFFIVLSFVAAGLAAFSFFAAEFSRNNAGKAGWQMVARGAFYTHGFSIVAIFSLMFYMIFNHHFEYHYAWRHSSYELPLEYIVSCFWEGQEGSFLLWQLWHVLLGVIFIRIGKNWEHPVMGIVSLTQFLLGSMVLGVFVFGYKIGVNPFTLLRNEMADAPIFQNPAYLSFIKDGNGLNPLLQNYWMVIHPPVLFLGFASTVIPFAFAIASMLRSDYTGWVKPALPWSLFSAGILGTGIFMGGAWAYESLSFGGFWAWDPVENASLVPWLTLVAGIHTLVIYRYTGRSLVITYFFLVISFILILYSTFLTRSGILGDTSVHAFTDLGMTGQLVIYLAVLSVPAIALIIYHMIKMPKQEGEEEFLSREFWMFIGSLIFLIAGIQITYDTSIPVWNTIFKTNIALPAEAVAHYNKVQIIIGIILAFGAAVTQFLVYQRAKTGHYFKWLGAILLFSLVLTAALGRLLEIDMLILYTLGERSVPFISTYWMLMLAGIFTALSNLVYIYIIRKSKWLVWAGSITHIGFGIFLVGILISQYKQEVISINKAGIDYGEGFNPEAKRENILLVQGDTIPMGGYEVTYIGRTQDGIDEYFQVDYIRRDMATGKIKEHFSLLPHAQINPSMGLISNPSTKHYLTKDIFTHVTSIPELPDEVEIVTVQVAKGDTFFTSRHFVILENIVPNPPVEGLVYGDSIIGLGADLQINGFDDFKSKRRPVYLINLNTGKPESVEAEDKRAALTLNVKHFNPETEKLTIEYVDMNGKEDFIIMKAIVFPYINLLWLGGIVMLLGFFISSARRILYP
jgi:cytochrome c-type biogenesis protein CcmF